MIPLSPAPVLSNVARRFSIIRFHDCRSDRGGTAAAERRSGAVGRVCGMTIEVRDPHFERRVRDSFGRQQFMTLLGASPARVAAGKVKIDLPFWDKLTQQHG